MMEVIQMAIDRMMLQEAPPNTNSNFFFFFFFLNHLTPHRAYCHGRGTNSNLGRALMGDNEGNVSSHNEFK